MSRSTPSKSIHPTVTDPDISHTTSIEDEQSPNITLRSKFPKRRRLSSEGSPNEFYQLQEMINNLMITQNKRLDSLEEHIIEVKNQNNSIKTTNQDIEKSMNRMSDQITAVEIKIDSLEMERSKLIDNLSLLEGKIDILEQNSLKTSIEIRNVPKIHNENKERLFSMIQHLSSQLNLQIKNSDVRDVYRMPSKKENKNSSVTIEFQNTLIKSSLINASKKYKKDHLGVLNASLLGMQGYSTPIYVSEQLSTKMKRLYYITQEFAKKEEYMYSWTANGKIYLRKKDGSPFILIKHESRLEELKKIAEAV